MEFKPDRWLEGGEGIDNPAYLPFFVVLEVTVRVFLLELLSKIKFEVDPRMGSREDVYSNQVLALTRKHQGGIHLIPWLAPP